MGVLLLKHQFPVQCFVDHCYTPAPRRGRGYAVLPLFVRPSILPSFHPSKIFFSVTVDGRNLIFGHKFIQVPHIMGSIFGPIRFLLPVCRLSWFLYTLNIICTFFVTFFSATIDGKDLVFGYKLHIGTPYHGKRFLTRQIPTSCLSKSGGIISEHQLTVHLVCPVVLFFSPLYRLSFLIYGFWFPFWYCILKLFIMLTLCFRKIIQ